MSKKVGNLFVSLGMNTASFKRSTQKATKTYKKFERKLIRSTRKMRQSINKMGTSMAKMAGVAVLAAGTVGIAALTIASFKSADQLAKTSDKLGITTEKLAGLQHAAELTGVSSNTLNKSLTKQQKAIADADNGLVTYKRHFDTLGISVANIMKLPVDKQFELIAEKLNKVTNATTRTAIAYDIFGGRGTALLNTLALGKDGLKAVQEEAKALGIAIDRISASKIESANDSVTRAKAAFKGLGNIIATKLAPFVDALATSFVNAAKESGGFKNEVTSSVDSIVSAIGFIADSAYGLQVVWKGVGTAFAGIANIFMQGLEAIGNAQLSFIRLFDKDFEKPKFLRVISSAARDAKERLNLLRQEFDKLLSKELPSDNIKKWAQDAQVAAQKAAEQVANSKSKIISGTGVGTETSSEIDKARSTAASKLEVLENSLMSENERMQESFLNRSFMVEDAFQNELIGLDKRNSLIESLETQHANKLNKINKDASDKRTKVLTGQLGAASSIFSSIGSLMGREGKKQSAIQKDLARASIIASTAQAVMNALAVSPYPLGVSLAIAAGLKGAEQLSKVGGGGGGGGGSTSIGGLSQRSTGVDQGFPTQSQSQPSQVASNNVTQVIFTGDMLGEDLSERLVEIIKDATNNKDIVLFDSDSRQADEIREAS